MKMMMMMMMKMLVDTPSKAQSDLANINYWKF